MIIFPLQWLAVLIVPKNIAERTSHAPEIIQSRQERIMAFLTQGFWIGATLYSIFVPFRVGTPWLWIGLALFITGLVTLILATVSVAGTPADKPFTSGVYRFSRHPMYLSMIFVYLGVSIAAASWLFLLITVITFFLQLYQAKKEEKYCCKEFGDTYREYMRRTARWIGILKLTTNFFTQPRRFNTPKYIKKE
ncbi:MAG: isoprenylcysteine carboxylmethyltransferase family protein [Dehalococcoidales bacterium]|nr:isoprenylcysteine carboxylmethyltransferase family protein [Dehalococcoidales bacterium]